MDNVRIDEEMSSLAVIDIAATGYEVSRVPRVTNPGASQNFVLPAGIMKLPIEILEQIMININSDAGPGSHLDDAATRKNYFNICLVNKTWHSLALYVFFRSPRIVSGYFPPQFDPRDIFSAKRLCSELEDFEDQEKFGVAQPNLVLITRSEYFLDLKTIHFDMIRVMSIEVSGSYGDMESEVQIRAHQNFANAISNAKNVQELTLNCHGQSRMDGPDTVLDPWLSTWAEHGSQQGHTDDDDDEGRNKLPIWRNLRCLRIIGKSGSTQLGNVGLGDFIDLIHRHRGTLEVLEMEGIAQKRDVFHEKYEAGKDKIIAIDIWTRFKIEVLDILMLNAALWKVEFRNVVLTIVRDGPPPQDLIKTHDTTHHYDWPYELDVVVNSPELGLPFEFVRSEWCCGCIQPRFGDPLIE